MKQLWLPILILVFFNSVSAQEVKHPLTQGSTSLDYSKMPVTFEAKDFDTDCKSPTSCHWITGNGLLYSPATGKRQRIEWSIVFTCDVLPFAENGRTSAVNLNAYVGVSVPAHITPPGNEWGASAQFTTTMKWEGKYSHGDALKGTCMYNTFP